MMQSWKSVEKVPDSHETVKRWDRILGEIGKRAEPGPPRPPFQCLWQLRVFVPLSCEKLHHGRDLGKVVAVAHFQFTPHHNTPTHPDPTPTHPHQASPCLGAVSHT